MGRNTNNRVENISRNLRWSILVFPASALFDGILVQAMQIIFWSIIGTWVLTRTKIRLKDMINLSGEMENEQR